MSNIFDNQQESVPFEEQAMQTEGQNAVEPTTEESVTQVSEEVTPPETIGQGADNAVVEAAPEWQKEFATPEDMYKAWGDTKKSYDHIRPKLTQTTQKLAELKKQTTNPTVEQPINVQQPVQQQPQVAQPQRSAEDIVKGFIEESNRPVVAQMENMLLTQEVNEVARKYEDFDQYSDQITKKLGENPALWNGPNAVENAYKLSKFDSMGSNIDQAIEKATTQAYADKQLKVLGTGNTAQPSTQQLEPNQVSAEDQAGNDIVASVARKKSIFF